MDSINRNQPEDNRQDLEGDVALLRIREMAKQAENCFFCTSLANGTQPVR